MTRAWVSLTVLLASAGLLCWAAESGTKQEDAAQAAGLVIGEPIKEGNLTIFPVVSKTPKRNDRFITLDEGLRSGKVEILEVSAVDGSARARRPNLPGTASEDPFGNAAADPFNDAPVPAQTPAEVQQQEQVAEQTPDNNEPPSRNLQLQIQGRGNDVNQLMVVNRSEKPLYLMPGEVIVGGDQDRTIGRELVIAPDGKPTPISVFCVEHGRWGTRDTQQYAALLSTDLAHTVRRPTSAASIDVDAAASSVDLNDFAKEANSGKFIGSIGSLNKKARLAVQKGDGQGEVWDEVAAQNMAVGVKPESGAFTANYASKDIAGRLARYQSTLEKKIADTPHVVGVIVAVDGKVESMDVFESTPLFTKLWPKLLKSYALDAVSADAPKGEAAKPVTVADAKRFMNEAASASAREVNRGEKGLATVQAESDRVLLFSAREQRPVPGSPESAAGENVSDAAPAAAGGFGGGVHTSAYAK